MRCASIQLSSDTTTENSIIIIHVVLNQNLNILDMHRSRRKVQVGPGWGHCIKQFRPTIYSQSGILFKIFFLVWKMVH